MFFMKDDEAKIKVMLQQMQQMLQKAGYAGDCTVHFDNINNIKEATFEFGKINQIHMK